jgi:hypothetical protein
MDLIVIIFILLGIVLFATSSFQHIQSGDEDKDQDNHLNPLPIVDVPNYYHSFVNKETVLFDEDGEPLSFETKQPIKDRIITDINLIPNDPIQPIKIYYPISDIKLDDTIISSYFIPITDLTLMAVGENYSITFQDPIKI